MQHRMMCTQITNCLKKKKKCKIKGMNILTKTRKIKDFIKKELIRKIDNQVLESFLPRDRVCRSFYICHERCQDHPLNLALSKYQVLFKGNLGKTKTGCAHILHDLLALEIDCYTCTLYWVGGWEGERFVHCRSQRF